MLGIRHKLVMLLFLTLLVGCDRVTKDAAVARLADGTVVSLVDQTLELRYTENRDVAFNLLRAVPDVPRTQLLQVLGPVSVAAIGVWLARRKFTSMLELVSASAVLAGAVGNTVDRWLRGYVVDFLHVTHWPVFNVADVCVTLGIAGLLVSRRSEPPDRLPVPIEPRHHGD